MPFRLKKVRLHNFASVRESELELPDYGMVLVRGVNECARGKLESSGAGKTAIGEAISRTCFGVEGRFKEYGHFSNDHTGNKDTLVEVDGTLDGKPISIKSGYKHPDLSNTGEGLAYRIGGADWVSRGHLSDTRKEVSTLLGVTQEVASWTIYVDGDQLKFSNLSQAALVDLVLASLNQPPWAEYSEKASKRYTRMKGEMSVHEQNVADTKAALDRAHRAVETAKTECREQKAEYEKRAARAAQATEKIQGEIAASTSREEKIVSKKKELQRAIKQHETSNAAAYAKFETQKLEIKAALTEARRKQEQLSESRSDARAEVRRLKDRVEELEELPETCPTCKQKWDHSHEKSGTKKLSLELKEAEEFLAAKTKLCAENQTEIDALTQKLDRLDQRISAQHQENTEELSDQLEELDQKLRTLLKDRQILQEDLAQASRVDDRDYMTAKIHLKAARDAVEGLEEDLRAANGKFSDSRKNAAISAYLRTAFGPTGIPNMVLQEALAPLNESSRLISARMTGNSISVQYSTTKELVTGKTRSELIIKTDNKFGSKRAKGSSKGESGLTNLIVAETIAEMSNVSARVAYRWYDEVLRNPDETMRRNFFSYVADLAKRKKMLCFVVDHGPEAANYADYVLVAHKTPKGTTYYWEA